MKNHGHQNRKNNRSHKILTLSPSRPGQLSPARPCQLSPARPCPQHAVAAMRHWSLPRVLNKFYQRVPRVPRQASGSTTGSLDSWAGCSALPLRVLGTRIDEGGEKGAHQHLAYADTVDCLPRGPRAPTWLLMYVIRCATKKIKEKKRPNTSLDFENPAKIHTAGCQAWKVCLKKLIKKVRNTIYM